MTATTHADRRTAPTVLRARLPFMRVPSVALLCLTGLSSCLLSLFDDHRFVSVNVSPGSYAVGSTCAIGWSVNDCDFLPLQLDVSRDGGASWETIALVENWTNAVCVDGPGWGYTVYSGRYDWGVTDGGAPLPQGNCLARATSSVDGDFSDRSEVFGILGKTVWYVDAAAAPGGDGLSWEAAFRHPQEAVDASAVVGDEIWVAGGCYTGSGDAVLAIHRTVSVFGGFAGTESSLDGRDWSSNVTVLDGGGVFGRRAVEVAASRSLLDGFTVAGGNVSAGAGILAYDSSDVTIAHCTISGNHSSYRGGGAYVKAWHAAFVDCIFLGNSADQDGGAVYGDYYGLELSGCRFDGNWAGASGGAVYSGSSMAASNCLFVNGSAGSEGSAVCLRYSGGEFCNCTMAGNTTPAGSALCMPGSGSLVNCIIWGNSGTALLSGDGWAFVCHSDVEGSGGSLSWDETFGYDAGGNIDADPFFVDAAGGDYRLQAGSPCIDTADPETTLTEDIEGNPRPAGSGCDMGAYEYQP